VQKVHSQRGELKRGPRGREKNALPAPIRSAASLEGKKTFEERSNNLRFLTGSEGAWPWELVLKKREKGEKRDKRLMGLLEKN